MDKQLPCIFQSLYFPQIFVDVVLFFDVFLGIGAPVLLLLVMMTVTMMMMNDDDDGEF